MDPIPSRKVKIAGIEIPASVTGLAFLGGLSGTSLLAMYGVTLAFVMRTIPADDQDKTAAGLRAYDEHGKKLKQTMIGLLVTTVVPLMILAFILAGFSKGTPLKHTIRSIILLATFAGLMVLTLISTSLAFTQDRRVTGGDSGSPDPKIKKGVEGALIGSAIGTVILGIATGAVVLKNRTVFKGAADALEPQTEMILKKPAGGST